MRDCRLGKYLGTLFFNLHKGFHFFKLVLMVWAEAQLPLPGRNRRRFAMLQLDFAVLSNTISSTCWGCQTKWELTIDEHRQSKQKILSHG